MATKRYTDIEIRNVGKIPLRESLGRGNGSILFKKPQINIEAYYIYSYNNSEPMIKIGNFKHGSLPGITSKAIRLKAKEYSELRTKHPDLKTHIDYNEQQRKLEEQFKEKTGTFKDLLNSYTDSLANEATKRTVYNLFNNDVIRPFPELVNKKASDIEINDIILILQKIFNRNVTTRAGKVLDRKVTTNGNRLRTYLSAAFNHAVKVTNDPLKQEKIFNVQTNPVVNIPKQTQFEKTQDRVLTIEEVKHLLTHIEQADNVYPLVAKTIKFLFYIGGQRPLQVLREQWTSYDYRKNTLLITDTKGRNGKREYLTPLMPKALAILDDLSTQDMPYPFTTTGKVPVRIETLLKAIKSYCKQYKVKRFTLRDIRRTCKNLMIDAGVNRETRNLIQNHGLTGIDFKHYDKHDHLPEKLAGMAKYDRFLDRIISDDTDNESNIVQLVTA